LIDARGHILFLKQFARDHNIFGKAKELAKRFGVRRAKTHGEKYLFVQGRLEILLDTGGPNMKIMWDGQLVFEYRLGCIEAFRPDIPDWIETMEQHYKELVVPQIIEEKKLKAKQEAKVLYERWGIKIE